MARTNGAVAAAHRGIELLGYSFGHGRCEVEAEGRGAGRSRSSGRGGEIIEGPGIENRYGLFVHAVQDMNNDDFELITTSKF
ncbi:hypothetical protein OsJ_13947 [Oryza sativa Japonica Group]|uniref:Uncharacterized protein n=1 Tax=Oryza sativa subsp. japonica TaxID=39947 RepID=B9FDZ5_ORYSJ|nr:hypothetical protein OsJ_13947 [Oryza sativa Japonica Group]